MICVIWGVRDFFKNPHLKNVPGIFMGQSYTTKYGILWYYKPEKGPLFDEDFKVTTDYIE